MITAVETVVKYMWGKNGEYGPFSAGKDGFPNAGEVIRHYRLLKKMRAKELGERYGKALGESAKSRIWVLTMERMNNVPLDITRRRALADILGIPYILLGLSEGLEKTPLLAEATVKTSAEFPRVPKRETMITEMLTEHEQTLTLYFHGYYHRHGQAGLKSVTNATEQISLWLPLATENTKQRGTTLLSRYHRFATNIAREQQRYDLAISHADKAIEHAEEIHKTKPNSDLMAITFYGRGFASFEQESTRIDQLGNYHDARSYIDAALSYTQSATPVMNGLISLEWGVIHAYTATSEDDKKQVRKRLKDGYAYIPESRLGDDPNFIAANHAAGWCHLMCAEALTAMGEYTEALGELELAEELTPLNLPRRFAYIDALRAKAYIGLREFKEAAIYAHDALIQSRTVKSEYNIARTAQIHRQLREKYKHSGVVTELGRELTKTHPHLVLF